MLICLLFIYIISPFLQLIIISIVLPFKLSLYFLGIFFFGEFLGFITLQIFVIKSNDL